MVVLSIANSYKYVVAKQRTIQARHPFATAFSGGNLRYGEHE